jgi:hypothetical protein
MMRKSIIRSGCALSVQGGPVLNPNITPVTIKQSRLLEQTVRAHAIPLLRCPADSVEWLMGRWLEELADAMAGVALCPTPFTTTSEFLAAWKADVAGDPFLLPALAAISEEIQAKEAFDASGR